MASYPSEALRGAFLLRQPPFEVQVPARSNTGSGKLDTPFEQRGKMLKRTNTIE